jgi:shikimate kinase
MATRIYLLGFMGAGKSHIGRHLAGRLHLDFLDLDAIIEKSEGMPIAAIFSTKGEHYFRQIEAECLRQTLLMDRVVIATGGGTPCYFDNLAWMNENGMTLFLDTCEEILHKRLMESRKRPLIAGKSEDELSEFIHQKLAARRPFYEGAQIAYETLSPAQDAVADLYGYLGRFVIHRFGKNE